MQRSVIRLDAATRLYLFHLRQLFSHPTVSMGILTIFAGIYYVNARSGDLGAKFCAGFFYYCACYQYGRGLVSLYKDGSSGRGTAHLFGGMFFFCVPQFIDFCRMV